MLMPAIELESCPTVFGIAADGAAPWAGCWLLDAPPISAGGSHEDVPVAGW